MMIRWNRFNIYLAPTLAVVMACGCQTPESKHQKELSTLRIHLETIPDSSKRSQPVPIYREHPVTIEIEKTPFLTEAHVKEAKVVDVMGGFAISIQFNREGKWLLESHSTANRGRRYAIFSQFGGEIKQGRWLAAPVFSQRILDGLLIFTPDATREEADDIVMGLNNVAKKLSLISTCSRPP